MVYAAETVFSLFVVTENARPTNKVRLILCTAHAKPIPNIGTIQSTLFTTMSYITSTVDRCTTPSRKSYLGRVLRAIEGRAGAERGADLWSERRAHMQAERAKTHVGWQGER